MAQILTVTPNAAIDRTLRVVQLRPGARHLVRSDHVQAGGKGINVARALARLGARARALVVVGGATGEAICRDLERAGLAPIAVRARGESRTCLEILDESSGLATQLHGRGVAADEQTAHELIAAVAEQLAGVGWLALCGSLAPGMPDDTYARLVDLAHARRVPVALDASGPALRAAWRRGPDLLRVNREEVAEALGVDGAALALPPPASCGDAGLSVVSDGRRPALAWLRAGARWSLTPPPVQVRNPIGCGDAMLAGLLAALAAGRGTADALRFATTLAAADAESEVAGRPDPERARALEPQVRIEAFGGDAS
jgi:tagatose 6-phosphate kinase